MRNVTCVETQTSVKWTYCLFPIYCDCTPIHVHVLQKHSYLRTYEWSRVFLKIQKHEPKCITCCLSWWKRSYSSIINIKKWMILKRSQWAGFQIITIKNDALKFPIIVGNDNAFAFLVLYTASALVHLIYSKFWYNIHFKYSSK